MENPDLIPSAELAYLGDSVIEVLVRERLVLTPSPQASSKRSLAFVTAVAQSKALDNIIAMCSAAAETAFTPGSRKAQAPPNTGARPEWSAYSATFG